MATVRYAVVGCGQRMLHLVGLLSSYDDIKLVGSWDPDARNSETLNRRGSPLQTLAPVQAYEDLLRLPGLDWVFVGSPNVFHRPQIEAALGYGKHVFSEKPLATSLEDCFALASLAAGSNRTLVTGFTLRYSPLYRRVKAVLDAGTIGKVVSIDANENLAPGHGAYIMTNWRRDYAVAGAHILEKCVHDLDLLNWFTGSVPLRVAAFGGNNVFVPEQAGLFEKTGTFLSWPATLATGLNPFTTEKTIEDNIVTILEYANGARAQFQLTSSNPLGERRMYISGTEGNLVVDLVSGVVKVKTIFDSHTTVWDTADAEDGHGGGDEVMIEELVQTMVHGVPMATGIGEGLRSTIVGLSLDRARREGRVVALDQVWTDLEARY